MFRAGRDASVLYWHGTVNLVPTQGSPVFGTGSLVYGILFHRDSQTAPRGGVAGIERIFCESKTATAGGSLLENVGHVSVRVSCVSSSTMLLILSLPHCALIFHAPLSARSAGPPRDIDA